MSVMYYNVYFENCNGEERMVGSGNTEKDAYRYISQDIIMRGEKSYYMRMWGDYNSPEGVTIDYGSHTQFYHIRKEYTR